MHRSKDPEPEKDGHFVERLQKSFEYKQPSELSVIKLAYEKLKVVSVLRDVDYRAKCEEYDSLKVSSVTSRVHIATLKVAVERYQGELAELKLNLCLVLFCYCKLKFWATDSSFDSLASSYDSIGHTQPIMSKSPRFLYSAGTVLLNSHAKLQARHSNLSLSHADLEAKYSSASTKLISIQIAHDKLSGAYGSLRMAYKSLSKEHADIGDSLVELSKKYAKLRSEVDFIHQTKASLESFHDYLRERHVALKKELLEFFEERASIKATIRSISNAYSQLSAECSSLHAENASLNASLASLASKLREAVSAAMEIDSQKDIVEARCVELQKLSTDLRSSLDTETQEHASTRAKLKTTADLTLALKDEVKSEKTAKEKLGKELEIVKSERTKHFDRARSIEGQLKASDRRYKELAGSVAKKVDSWRTLREKAQSASNVSDISTSTLLSDLNLSSDEQSVLLCLIHKFEEHRSGLITATTSLRALSGLIERAGATMNLRRRAAQARGTDDFDLKAEDSISTLETLVPWLEKGQKEEVERHGKLLSQFETMSENMDGFREALRLLPWSTNLPPRILDAEHDEPGNVCSKCQAAERIAAEIKSSRSEREHDSAIQKRLSEALEINAVLEAARCKLEEECSKYVARGNKLEAECKSLSADLHIVKTILLSEEQELAKMKLELQAANARNGQQADDHLKAFEMAKMDAEIDVLKHTLKDEQIMKLKSDLRLASAEYRDVYGRCENLREERRSLHVKALDLEIKLSEFAVRQKVLEGKIDDARRQKLRILSKLFRNMKTKNKAEKRDFSIEKISSYEQDICISERLSTLKLSEEDPREVYKILRSLQIRLSVAKNQVRGIIQDKNLFKKMSVVSPLSVHCRLRPGMKSLYGRIRELESENERLMINSTPIEEVIEHKEKIKTLMKENISLMQEYMMLSTRTRGEEPQWHVVHDEDSSKSIDVIGGSSTSDILILRSAEPQKLIEEVNTSAAEICKPKYLPPALRHRAPAKTYVSRDSKNWRQHKPAETSADWNDFAHNSLRASSSTSVVSTSECVEPNEAISDKIQNNGKMQGSVKNDFPFSLNSKDKSSEYHGAETEPMECDITQCRSESPSPSLAPIPALLLPSTFALPGPALGSPFSIKTGSS